MLTRFIATKRLSKIMNNVEVTDRSSLDGVINLTLKTLIDQYVTPSEGNTGSRCLIVLTEDCEDMASQLMWALL